MKEGITSIITGYGSYLPERIVKNSELEKTLDTSDAWITERTGIKQRHIAAEGELTSHLGTKAAMHALDSANLKANDIDLLIVATSTPDNTLPATATKIQHQLGMTKGVAFDISAACSGFVYALTIADNFIKNGSAKRALVICSEIFSRIVDWKDRSTCILFGDGAAAVVLESDISGSGRGLLYSKIFSDGQYYDILKTTGGVTMTKNAGVVAMNGKEVFRHAVAKMSDAILEGLATIGASIQDIDWLIPHQANDRILQAIAKRLDLSESKVVSTVAMHANTSAASIPLAIAQAVKDGRIRKGQLIVMPALGAGLTWGTCILRW